MPYYSPSTSLAEVLDADVQCKARGGIKQAYWALYSEVDWDNVTWDDTDGVTAYAMLLTNVFRKLEGTKKASTFTSSYSQDSDFYADLVSFAFDSLDKVEELQTAIELGCIVLHIVDANGNAWIFGVQYDGTDFSKSLTPLGVSEHVINGGQLGSTKAGQTFALAAESDYGPIKSNILTDAGMPL